jgi:hypothetical protein
MVNSVGGIFTRKRPSLGRKIGSPLGGLGFLGTNMKDCLVLCSAELKLLNYNWFQRKG